MNNDYLADRDWKVDKSLQFTEMMWLGAHAKAAQASV